MRNLSADERRTLRKAKTEAQTKFNLGGREKKKQPKPITLTRAQYEANKQAGEGQR